MFFKLLTAEEKKDIHKNIAEVVRIQEERKQKELEKEMEAESETQVDEVNDDLQEKMIIADKNNEQIPEGGKKRKNKIGKK